MMAAFFDWLASLGWGASLCFALAFGVGGCIIILLIDFAVRSHEERRELRAIKNRLWEARKKKLLDAFEGDQQKAMRRRLDDAQFLRLLEIDTANDAAQGIRERQQFHIPPCFRDFKGVHKP